MKQKKTTIIVAGGKGQRMKSIIPKQFMELNGIPILMRTIRTFHRYDTTMKLILVLPESDIAFWRELCEKHNFTVPHQIVTGGNTRYHSVKNALEFIKQNSGLIAIHDGVRPLIDESTIERCFQVANDTGASVAAIDLTDSIRKITGDKSVSVNREHYKTVQTPQIFKAEILYKAYEQPFIETFTDDASVVESAGYTIKLVDGTRQNIKITTAFDLKVAELVIKQQ